MEAKSYNGVDAAHNLVARSRKHVWKPVKIHHYRKTYVKGEKSGGGRTKQNRRALNCEPDSHSTHAFNGALVHKNFLTLLKTHPYHGIERGELKDSEFESYKAHLNMVKSLMKSAIHSTYLVRLPLLINIDSDLAGIISYQHNWNNVASCTDWTHLSSLFDEFRIRAVEYHVEPKNKYSKVTTISQPIICTHDNDGNTAPSSFDVVAQYPQSKTSNTDDMYHKPVWHLRPKHPDSIIPGEMWTDVADVASVLGCTMLYSDTLTASARYGIAFQYFHVEFKFAR